MNYDLVNLTGFKYRNALISCSIIYVRTTEQIPLITDSSEHGYWTSRDICGITGTVELDLLVPKG